ncbi:hypothetical protein [Polyangium spumosum]|uniref:Uncharacterized protein n=1 Tax=Polyangium spumosum TaxID=889282 RepID=A0A6N7PSI8_9BACT|nr:hypothetical protein [Polyangium spumosum]MRG91831.1 hypothetical protein [Polyangium spumosum]
MTILSRSSITRRDRRDLDLLHRVHGLFEVPVMSSFLQFLPRVLFAGCFVAVSACGGLLEQALPLEAPAHAEPTPAPKEPKEPVVAAPYQHRIVFGNQPFKADASNASTAIDVWTLGDPLYIHAYGPSPKSVVLYAEVNGEPALGAGAEIVAGAKFGALGEVHLDGGGTRYPVQGALGPQARGVNIGGPSTYDAGVWADRAPHWARIWQEFHSRIVPMLHVGDNTLKLTLANAKRTETFAEGSVTIKVPSEGALKADLASNTEKAADGDAALLRDIDKLVRTGPHFRGAQIVRIAYRTGVWLNEARNHQIVAASTAVNVIHRKSDDAYPARCRVTGLVVRREAQGNQGGPLGKVTLHSRTVETRWTPCP